MTDEQRKEFISRAFMRIVAHGHGFKVHEPEADHGVDMTISPVTRRNEPGGKIRYLDSQHRLDFQLKATTPHSIVDAGDDIKYDLEVKNYNDLIQRRGEFLPLHLVLIVLSDTPPACVNFDADTIGIIGKAYWYLPADDAELSANVNQIRITIPKVNQLGVDFLRNRYGQFGVDV